MIGRTNLSRSQNKILQLILDSRYPLTQKEIAKETGFSARTIKYAIKLLIELNAITEFHDLKDLRIKNYGGKNG